jgi:hypothetical protein
MRQLEEGQAPLTEREGDEVWHRRVRCGCGEGGYPRLPDGTRVGAVLCMHSWDHVGRQMQQLGEGQAAHN